MNTQAGPSQGSDDTGLIEIFLEHADCGGSLEVGTVEEGSGVLHIHCSGCGDTVEYRRPGAPAAGAPGEEGPSESASPTGREQGPPKPAAIEEPPADATPEPEPEAREGGDRIAAVPASQRKSLPAPREEQAEVPGERVRSRRSRQRALIPLLAGAAFLAIALVVAAEISSDEGGEPASDSAQAPPAAEAPGEQGPDDRRQGGGKQASGGRDRDDGGGGGGGGADRPAVPLQTTTARGAVAVGLPEGWTERGTSSSGAVVYGPADDSAHVDVFFERGSSLGVKAFADRAASFVAARRADSDPGRPRVAGNSATVRAPYPGGLEIARVVIDEGLHVMGIATVPDAAPAARERESQAILRSLSAP